MPKVTCYRCGKKFKISTRKVQKLRDKQRRDYAKKHGSMEGYIQETLKDAMLGKGKPQAYWEYSKYCPDCRAVRESEIVEPRLAADSSDTPEFGEDKEKVPDSPRVEYKTCKRDGCENRVFGDGEYCGISCSMQAKYGDLMRKCPYCNRFNKVEAVVCGYCKRNLPFHS